MKLRGAPFNVKEVIVQELPNNRHVVKILHLKSIKYGSH